MMEWINVNDQTPEEGVNVFAVCDGELQIMAYCCIGDNEDEKAWVWCMVYDGIKGDAYFDDNYNVTYWMPLPTALTE
jgi:hypothetical protein